MSFQVILGHIYEATLLGAALFAIFRYRNVDKATRLIFYWIWLGVVTEGIGEITKNRYGTNIHVYGISCLMEFFILCSYFNESVPTLKKKHLGLLIGAAGILLGLLNILFLQPLNRLNSNFLFFEALVIVCLSLYALYRKFADPDLRLLKESHFCLACLLLFYECASLWNWGIYDYVLQVYPEQISILNISLVAGNTLTYTICGLLIYFYPKMYQVYV